MSKGLVTALVAIVLIAACREKPVEPLKLEGGNLIVDNRSDQEWRDVEIWLNHHYRVQARVLESKGRLNVPLNVFVAGFGQKFDWRSQQITDLKLKAKLPDGSPLEIKKDFQSGALSDALSGVGKKR